MIQRIVNIDNDLVAMCERGNDFFAEAQLPGTFKTEIFLTSWRALFAAGYGAMWKSLKDGTITGLLGALLSFDLNDGATTASEAFWFVLPEHRNGLAGIRLFEAFEQWADDVGASRRIMAHINGLHPEKMRDFYVRRGYRPIETHYVKEKQ